MDKYDQHTVERRIMKINFKKFKIHFTTLPGRRACALNSGLSGLGSIPGRGHCVVFLGKTRNSHSASLHPGE